MGWPTDTLAGVFLSLFVFGLIFSVASTLLGAVGGHLHLPGGVHAGHASHVGHHGGHGHGGHATHGHGAAHAGGQGHGADAQQNLAILSAPSPLNVSTLMIFVTWFGAAGYILRAYYGALAALSLAVAVLVGAVGAAVVWVFMAKVLWRGQMQLDPANYLLDGAPAQVTWPIRAGGTGEIVYVLDGKRRVDGARSVDGAAIAAGTEVAIVRYTAGLAYVCPLDWAREDDLSPSVAPGSAAREGEAS